MTFPCRHTHTISSQTPDCLGSSFSGTHSYNCPCWRRTPPCIWKWRNTDSRRFGCSVSDSFGSSSFYTRSDVSWCCKTAHSYKRLGVFLPRIDRSNDSTSLALHTGVSTGTCRLLCWGPFPCYIARYDTGRLRWRTCMHTLCGQIPVHSCISCSGSYHPPQPVKWKHQV